MVDAKEVPAGFLRQGWVSVSHRPLPHRDQSSTHSSTPTPLQYHSPSLLASLSDLFLTPRVRLLAHLRPFLP